MKMRLIGGPLDGTTIKTPHRSIEPDLVLFSESRRIHHYLCHDGDEFVYLSRDTIFDDPRPFEQWWKTQAGDDATKEIAWAAWQEAMYQF